MMSHIVYTLGLLFACWVILHAFCRVMLFFSKSHIFWKVLSGIPSEPSKYQIVLEQDQARILREHLVRKPSGVLRPGPEVIKKFMLNSTEHEISTAQKN